MFKIKSYLQYKNTVDGKPKLLVEGVDYMLKDSNYLYNDFKAVEDEIEVARLSDCRPLLTVEIHGVKWTEGDIVQGYEYNSIVTWHFNRFVLRDNRGRIEEINKMMADYHKYKIIGSFFDDPAKYSKLIWDCGEEEGWKKILFLLNIK